MEKISGIYKITSPSNKTYVGQSKDIYKRFKQYKQCNSRTKQQRRLYNSFLKHGILNHTFEILEECTSELLNKKERYWQEKFDCIGKFGLNCFLTNSEDKPCVMSPETRLLLSQLQTGESNGFYGKSHSHESKSLMSSSAKNRNEPLSVKLNKLQKIKEVGLANKGIPKSEQHCENIAKAKRGSKNPMFGKTGASHPNSKKVVQKDLDLNVIKIWDSLADIARHFNISVKTISDMLSNGRTKTKLLPNSYWEYLILDINETLN